MKKTNLIWILIIFFLGITMQNVNASQIVYGNLYVEHNVSAKLYCDDTACYNLTVISTSGDINAVNTPDNYLYGGATSGGVNLRVNETKLNATITTITDARDSDTTYTNGTGLSLIGTTFSVVLSYFQGLFIELTDSFGGDVSGTYNNLAVIDSSHLHSYQNITNEPWIENSQESGLNVNSSTYWDNRNALSEYGIGNFTAWDKSYSDLINKPTVLSNFSNDVGYSTTVEILAFGYYNASDFVITDYFTKSNILNFGYYNLSNFDITDYLTGAEIFGFNYYNASNFDISDYLTALEILGFNYYNSSDFVITDYYTKTQVDNFNFYNLSDFNINDYATKIYADSLGNFTAWDKDYNDLINTPTVFGNTTTEIFNVVDNGTFLKSYTETDPIFSAWDYSELLNKTFDTYVITEADPIWVINKPYYINMSNTSWVAGIKVDNATYADNSGLLGGQSGSYYLDDTNETIRVNQLFTENTTIHDRIDTINASDINDYDSLGDLQTAVSNDFHNLGGTDIDTNLTEADITGMGFTKDIDTNCSVDNSCPNIAYDYEINKTYVDTQDVNLNASLKEWVLLKEYYNHVNNLTAVLDSVYVSFSNIVSIVGNFSAWNKAYEDLINKPTVLSNFTDDIGVSADWDDISDVPVGIPSDGNTTHLSLSGQIYSWVTGLNYITNAVSNLVNYYLKSEVYNKTEVDTNLALQDECSEIAGCVENAFNTEGNLTFLLDDNYIAIGTKLGNTSTEIFTVVDNGTFIKTETWLIDKPYYINTSNTSWITSNQLFNTTSDMFNAVNNNTFYLASNPSGYITDADDAVNSTELDNLCLTNDKILKRIAGIWQCADDEVGEPGAGDIESVQGDNIYIYNGSNTGAVNLAFNESKLNGTIQKVKVDNATYSDSTGLWNDRSALSDFGIGNFTSGIVDYSTTAEIIAFGYYNSTNFVITDYFTKSNILNFGYYNASDFVITDYLTSAQILAFDYYNSSDFSISDYVTSAILAGYSYYNASNFVITDYYTSASVDVIITGIGNFSDWDKDYGDLINTPTALSEFTDDLGNRGYTHLTNFTDNILWTSGFNTTFDSRDSDTTYTNASFDLSGLAVTGDVDLGVYKLTSHDWTNVSITESQISDLQTYLTAVTGTELDNVWNTNGILTRTGANTYSTITDNSANWNTSYTFVTNGTFYLATNPSGYITTDTNTNCSVDNSCVGIVYEVELNKSYVDTQDSVQDECSEITGCIENAYNAEANLTGLLDDNYAPLGYGDEFNKTYTDTLYTNNTDTNTNCSIVGSCPDIAYDTEVNKTYIDTQDSAQDECSEITGCIENAWTALTNLTLNDGLVYIGDASNNPSAQTIGGDITITNVGVVTIIDSSHVHDAANITTGTIDNARITLVEDEVPTLSSTWDNTMDADRLTGLDFLNNKITLSGENITAGTVAEARIDALIARDTEVVTANTSMKNYVDTNFPSLATIIAFGYYNASDFSITDYPTTSVILGWSYYNVSDFDITDYSTTAEAGALYAVLGYGDEWNKTYADTLYTNNTDTNTNCSAANACPLIVYNTNTTWITANQAFNTTAQIFTAVDNGTFLKTYTNLTEANVEAYIFDADNTGNLTTTGSVTVGSANVTGNMTVNELNIAKINSSHWKIFG